MKKGGFVYILASQKNGTLYIGVTSDLHRRILEHKSGMIPGFTKKFKVNMLVYFEEFASIEEAILIEKQIKKWNRLWKLDLIERENPNWVDLAQDWQV